jgi:hypothetical protein
VLIEIAEALQEQSVGHQLAAPAFQASLLKACAAPSGLGDFQFSVYRGSQLMSRFQGASPTWGPAETCIGPRGSGD